MPHERNPDHPRVLTLRKLTNLLMEFVDVPLPSYGGANMRVPATQYSPTYYGHGNGTYVPDALFHEVFEGPQQNTFQVLRYNSFGGTLAGAFNAQPLFNPITLPFDIADIPGGVIINPDGSVA